MKTVIDPLTAVLDALDAELARITEHRNDLAALIDQLRGASPVQASPPPAVAAGKVPAAGTGQRRLRPVPASTAKPASKRRPQVARPCPVPGCGRMCGGGQGLAAHIRNAHPGYTAAPAASMADAEQGLAAL